MPDVRSLLLPLILMNVAVHGADIRERIRAANTGGTAVTESQAQALTLTLTEATARQIQTWVRASGDIDESKRVITADIYPPDAELIRLGQRVRGFSLASRSSMYQGRVTRIIPQADHVTVEAALTSTGYPDSTHYLVEIVADRGTFLSVPNEALIHEGERQIVYVQKHLGHYEPKEIHTGLQGELYTQVLHGLSEGEEVVTLGSFFIDAEYKLKVLQDAAGGAANEHHHH